MLRREVTKLQRRFDFNFYAAQSADSRLVPPSLAAFGLAPQPSQGGVEMAWIPPKIGFRNERQFQVFSRLIWNFEPGSLAIKSSTLQLGIGARYKPLRTQNLWFSGERLIKLGDLSINNWLLRVMYGWNSLDRLPRWRPRGNYSVVYQDLGFYLQQTRTIAWYGEGRQGYAWRLPGNLMLAPHVMIMGQAFGVNRVANPSIQGGPGVSLQWWFWNTEYEADRARLEIIGQYRWGVLYPIVTTGPTEDFSGPVVIVVLNW